MAGIAVTKVPVCKGRQVAGTVGARKVGEVLRARRQGIEKRREV